MKKTINLLNALGVKSKIKKKPAAGNLWMLICFMVLLVVLSGVSAVLFIRAGSIKAEARELARYIFDEGNVSLYDELTAMQQETLLMRSKCNMIDTAKAVLESDKRFNSDVYRVLIANKPQRVSLEEISYAKGVLTIRCMTQDNLPPADYAKNLDGCGEFSAVQYSGYSLSGAGQFMFVIVCS